MTDGGKRPDSGGVILLAAHPHEALHLGLLAISFTAWSVLVFSETAPALPALCSGRTLFVGPGAFKLVLAVTPPLQLAYEWMLMLAAMMTPVIGVPLARVHNRSPRARRMQAMLLFAAGYLAVWMTVGMVLQTLALAIRLTLPLPRASLALALGVAVLWQFTPAKRWCLKRYHGRPHLADRGAEAHRDAFGFGLKIGASCAGACWAPMLVPLFVDRGHLLAMFAVGILISLERTKYMHLFALYSHRRFGS